MILKKFYFYFPRTEMVFFVRNCAAFPTKSWTFARACSRSFVISAQHAKQNHPQLLRYEKNGAESACGTKNKHI
jgi:hypothetical protein